MNKSISTDSINQWVEERTHLVSDIQAITDATVPAHVARNPMYLLGSVTLVAFVLQAMTGIMMMFYYDPSTAGAYDSVDFITYQLPLGWLVRGVHHWGASAVVVLTVLHMFRTYIFGAYKKPREVNWLSGVVLLLICLGFGFTGYLLPWDQRGYWATRVGTEIAGSVPVIGGYLSQLMRGGPIQGQFTLTRFFATHVLILPLSITLFTAVHLSQLKKHGISGPLDPAAKPEVRARVPLFPNFLLQVAVLAAGIAGLLVYLSAIKGAPLEFPADPTNTNYVPRPEWYFLFFFQLLRYFPGALESIATVLIPLFIFGCMIALPFVDRSAERRPWKKPVTTAAGIFYVGAIVILTALSFT